MELSKRLARVQPSATLSINAKAQQLRREGVRVVNFAVGEPDFDTPAHVKQAAVQALHFDRTRYTPVSGIPELKQAVCDWIRDFYGLNYSPSSVLVSCGGKHAIYNVLQAILNPGDEVIIPAPYWVSYPEMVALCDGVPVIVDCDFEKDYKLTPALLENAITDKTRLVILNSPSNPTGCYYDRDELVELVAVLNKHPHVTVLSDDIYSHILFNNRKWVNVAMVDETMLPRTVIIQAVSKTYAMTGWRIGFAVGPEEIISAASTVQSQSTSNPCSIAQWAAIAALRGDQTCVARMAEEFENRCQYLVERLRQIPGVKCVEPQGAFYAFPDVSAFYGKKYDGIVVRNSVEMAEYLIDKANVAVVPGSAFGNDRCIRLSFALSWNELEEGLNRIDTALKALR
ncbi:pyridoxal phosphate-dependent aminotransferase [Thermodesulforhabdus norvegica]|uniref:L-aspartate aminotransferase apoenzyme n=1 Tax=Thermodesulforhabdus norvegica TaxID=39841 RepID=A0A1I4QFT7_9BACT|nr:pyridoxal phosphate-dependent aminotransferase [Thermodesulforhabdus norvegica]SFM38961.1 L-aspartate aminotransferase apoenzyme [Thermodesulforhabdus norvegica]